MKKHLLATNHLPLATVSRHESRFILQGAIAYCYEEARRASVFEDEEWEDAALGAAALLLLNLEEVERENAKDAA